MKKTKRFNLIHVLAVIGLAFCACLLLPAGRAEAAAGYQELFPSTYKDGEAVKSGKYSFKYANNTVSIYNAKSGRYEPAPLNFDCLANGKKAFYVRYAQRKYALYQYTFDSMKEKRLKVLLADPEWDRWSVSAVYGSRVFLTKGNEDKWKYTTYTFDTAKKKLSMVKDRCAIISCSGKYAAAQDEYRTDVSAFSITLYQITASGLKKVKTLAKYGFNAVFNGKNLYYTSYTDTSLRKGTLYRCSINGTKKKKLGTFKASGEYGQVVLSEITSKSCLVWNDGKNYKYTYAGKKMKRIS